ncbi:GNAT family N-acetyltransferase [Natronospora cellulosivora (SeqCode)]
MKIQEMNSENLKEVAKLYLKLVDFMKEDIGDAYFDYDSISDKHFTKWLKTTLDDDNQVTYIACDKKNVIAFISGEIKDCFLPISNVKKIGYIIGAFVISEYRKQGIMKKLETTIVDFFDKKDISFVELNVISANQLGSKTWDSLGYQEFRKQMRKRIK